MTQAKRHLPNQAYFSSRRTHDGEFLLLDDREHNCKQIIFYSLGLHALKTNQDIIAFVAMSNHIHGVYFDPDASRSAFHQHFHSCIARSVNKFRARRGNFWSNQTVSDPALLCRESLIAKIVYTALNPVRAGLVEKAKDWPTTILPDDWGKTIRVERPETYFRDTPAHPDVIEFTPSAPPGFDDWELNEIKMEVNKRIEEGEREIAEERRANGKSVKGMDAVYSESPNRKIGIPKAKSRRPQFFASDASLYKRAAAALRKFRADLRNAVAQFKRDRKAAFPAGTIFMKRRFGVRCCEVEFDDPHIPDYAVVAVLAP